VGRQQLPARNVRLECNWQAGDDLRRDRKRHRACRAGRAVAGAVATRGRRVVTMFAAVVAARIRTGKVHRTAMVAAGMDEVAIVLHGRLFTAIVHAGHAAMPALQRQGGEQQGQNNRQQFHADSVDDLGG